MFEIPLQTLPFILIFGLGIALFHTVILSGLFNLKLKPYWLMFVIDPLIIVLSFFLIPKWNGLIFIILFGSVFVLGILGMLLNGVNSFIKNIKEQRKDKKPWWKILAGSFFVLAMYLGFFYFGIYSFFIIFGFLILSSVLPNNTNRFYYYQRNLPTSKIKSVAVGLSEISGKAVAITKVITPKTKTSCVGYIYTVDEVRTSRDDDGRTSTSYHEIERKVEINPFLLKDETSSIEVHPENLQWIGFQPSYEYQSSHRYREFILDEKTPVLMIGQTYYKGAKNIFRYDNEHKVFGISGVKNVDFVNKWRPLKIRTVTTLLCIALLCALVFITPMKASGSKLIIKKINWTEKFNENPFDIFNF